VFLKLYEEKRERSGSTNRLRSVAAFEDYQRDSVSAQVRKNKQAIHKLFDDVTSDPEFQASGMFSGSTKLEESVDDDFILSYVIPVLGKYTFYGTRIDALGALYERLALRAAKDIKAGQFFTPENVVRFMVRLAELDYKDMVLDPACGTGRFLIYAMNAMLERLERSGVRNKNHEREQVCLHRLFGADIDQRIAKIAKMNMWIHGDGKSNIFGGREYNGLMLRKHRFDGHDSFDNAFDVVLTNPPLGELNYQAIPFFDLETVDEDSPEADMLKLLKTFRRIPILPRKNLTEEQLKTVRERLEVHRRELTELERQLAEAEQEDALHQGQLSASLAPAGKKSAKRRRPEQTEAMKAYKRFSSTVQSKRRVIEQNEKLAAELEAKLLSGIEEQIQWEITGTTMKGGALFLAAIWHFLKDVAYPDELPEWRSGKVLLILDEGILNTDDYKEVRAFLRSHYYIKAIISLTRDTFVPVSKTTTKTSILYAVKKTDLDAVQQEPVFFGHVDQVGWTTKNKVGPNDFELMFERYMKFKEKVLQSYAGAVFRKERFLAKGVEEGSL